MDTQDIAMINIDNRKIVVTGIGKLFYQEGFPMSMAASTLAQRGYEVSWLHIADELLKHGWSPETVEKKIREDIQDGENPKQSIEQIKLFIHATYEEQREMIFQYLFGRPTKGASDDPVLVKKMMNLVSQTFKL